MSTTLQKITEQQMNEKGVCAAPDVLNGTPAQNKAVFDRMIRQLVAPAYNAAVDAIDEINETGSGIEAAEQERVTAEQGRTTAEQGRAAAEQGRVTAEQQRADENAGIVAQAAQKAQEASAAAETAQEAAERFPYIGENGSWYVYNAQAGAFVDTGINARGESGVYYGETEPTDPSHPIWIDPTGDADASPVSPTSPTVNVTEIEGGRRLTITDVNGTETVDVMDGAKGDKGDTGDTGPAGAQGPKGETGAVGAQGIQGPAGANGITPNLTVGAVTTLNAGSEATVTRRVGSPDTAPIFDFGIPKGADGVGGGSGEQWEFINVIEPTAEANALHITQDFNGQPFTLKKAFLFGYYSKYMGEQSLPSNVFVSMNNTIFGASHSLIYSMIGKPSKTLESSFAYLVETRLCGHPHHECCIRTRSGSNPMWFASDNVDRYDMYCRDAYGLAPNGLTELGIGSGLVYEGCYFALYGVRA